MPNDDAINKLWEAYGFIDERFKLDSFERQILSLETRRALLVIAEPEDSVQIREVSKDICLLKSMRPNKRFHWTLRLKAWLKNIKA